LDRPPASASRPARWSGSNLPNRRKPGRSAAAHSGISDKVLMMSLSSLLLASGKPVWMDVGANMIAVDTLVHNWLWRTGILKRFAAEHAYSSACYGPGACADVIREVASTNDASKFNPTFPRSFPRFVQHAVWRYCSQNGLNECNGNRNVRY
jgi:hypothetical protein